VRISRLAILGLFLSAQAGAIGVRQLDIHLPSGEAARATLWYPSASSGQPVRMSDYLHMEGHKGDLGEAIAALLANNPADVPADQRAEALTTRFRALRDARPRAGRYPLILWSLRPGTVSAQAYLSEALARAGFLVAVVEPLAWKPASTRGDFTKHTLFLEQSIGELAKLPQIDASRIAVIGWSHGGESAIQLAGRNPSVVLLIVLAPDAPAGGGKLNVPVVWFDERVPPENATSDVHHTRLRGVSPRCFSTVEGWLAARAGVKEPHVTPACARGYEHAVELVVRYATYYLRTATSSAR